MKKVIFFLIFGFILPQEYNPITGAKKEINPNKVLFDPMTGKIISSNNNTITDQNKGKTKLNEKQLLDIANLHARTDANAKTTYYFVGTSAISLVSLIISSKIEEPLFLATPIVSIISAQDKGDFQLPDFRKIEYNLKYDENDFLKYQFLYENERAKIQRKKHFISSLLGQPVVWFASVLVLIVL